ncbi:putative transcriptional regulator [Bacillus sp. TS-2]|nr:putative transcriptional regulator [Bacillus sp. TS-2]
MTVTNVRLNMKSLRKEKKLSQHALAIKVGCTANHIRFIESGRVNPSVQLVNSICKELKADVYTVFPDIFENVV